jgi:cytochrome c oxidase subunit 3
VLGFNTALLLISSATIDMARRDIIQKTALAPLKSIPGISIEDRRGSFWLGLTVLLGVAFLTGQRMAWGELKRRGFFIDTNPSASFIYILTAAHALHLCGGVAALGWASLTSLLHRPVETRRIWIDITAWYWHFMAVLWIYVFALLGIAR